jgi:ABC-type transporter Mla MlaB component
MDSLVDLPVDESAQAQATQVDTRGWRHTLILTGSLDHSSAVELQDELESLRQEGVAALTVDLRQLDGIDSPGAQVIASEGALFKQGGRGFAVIPGTLLGQGLLAQGRLKHLLVNASHEGFVPRFAKSGVAGEHVEPSTTMTKHLAPDSAEVI